MLTAPCDRALYVGRCAKQRIAVRMLSRECAPGTPPHFCTPHAAMLQGVGALAGPSGRSVSVAQQQTGAAGAGGHYTAGVLNLHRPGFSYALHFDAVNANAWAALRRWMCDEKVEQARGGLT
jgi:hypothetical protein